MGNNLNMAGELVRKLFLPTVLSQDKGK